MGNFPIILKHSKETLIRAIEPHPPNDCTQLQNWCSSNSLEAMQFKPVHEHGLSSFTVSLAYFTCTTAFAPQFMFLNSIIEKSLVNWKILLEKRSSFEKKLFTLRRKIFEGIYAFFCLEILRNRAVFRFLLIFFLPRDHFSVCQFAQ